MAMSKCKECNAKVSTLAKTCPKCGAPDPTAKETTTKETTTKKGTQKSSNNFVKVLATIGLIIAIGLILRGVFDVGKVGYKKVKKNITKEKTFKDVTFTCEGQATTKTKDLTGDYYDTDTVSFIDHYQMFLDDNGKPIQFTLKETNNWFARRKVSFASHNTLKSNPSAIKIDDNLI